MRTRSGRCRTHRGLAAAAATTAVALAGGASSASAADCGAQAAIQPALDHIDAAHLERSPLQQTKDLADVDDYVLAHTVLIESILAPAMPTAVAVVEPAEAHIYAAHLERSPLQQAKDLADVDDYVLAHTVLVEAMLQPVLSGCSDSAAPAPMPAPMHGSPSPVPVPAPAPAPAPAAPAPAPTAAAVEIHDFAFMPKTIAVPVGTTVTWTNEDGTEHNVTGAGLKSASFGAGGTYSYTFAKAGTFMYACSLHPQMKGTVTVR
jgi:plastocyanin